MYENQGKPTPSLEGKTFAINSPEKILNDESIKRERIFEFQNTCDNTPYCTCSLCLQEKERKGVSSTKYIITEEDYNADQQKQKLNNDVERNYAFIIRRLLTSKLTTRPLHIFIPDTCIFLSGEPKLMIYSSRDKGIKTSKQKDGKYSLHQVRKYFQEKRRKEGQQLNEGSANNNSKEIVLCKFTDENMQIMSELEFTTFILKRKIDPIWREVEYIQSFIRSKKNNHEIMRFKYNYEENKENPLFKRALNDVLIINADIPSASEDFFSQEKEEEYEEELKSANLLQYLSYLTFKIVNFVEIYHGVRVLKFMAEFIIDENNCAYFIGCTNLDYNEFHRENAGDLYKNIMKDPAVLMRENIDKYYKNLQKKEVQGLIADILFKDYNQRKQKEKLQFLNITKPEDLLNEEIFQKLHPGTPYKLQDLLNSSYSSMAFLKLRELVKNGLTPVKPSLNFEVIDKNSVPASTFIRKAIKKSFEPPNIFSSEIGSHQKTKSSVTQISSPNSSGQKFFPKIKPKDLRCSTIPSISQTSTVICKYQINLGNNISQIKLSGNIYRRLKLNEQKRKAATLNKDDEFKEISETQSLEESFRQDTQGLGFFPTTTASSAMDKSDFVKKKFQVSNYYQWKIAKSIGKVKKNI